MDIKTKFKYVITKSIFCAFGFLATSATYAENFYQFEAGYTADDNLGLATEKANFKRDQKINAYGSYGYFKSLDNGKSFTATAFADIVSYDTYDGLNRLDIGTQLAFDKKVGVGDFAPTWSLGASILKRNVKSNVRDAWVYSINAGFNKQLNDYWGLFSQLSYSKENADSVETQSFGPSMIGPSMPDPMMPNSPKMPTNNNAFDLTNTTLATGVEYALNDNHFLKLGYSYRTGDVASLARNTDPIIQYFTAITRDTAFLEKMDDDLFIYRIDADSHILQLGWDIALSDNSSISFNFDHQQTSGKGGLDYDRNVYAIKYIYSH